MDFNSIPKIDLHCHLDGSLDIDTSRELLEKRGKIYTREQLVSEMTVTPGCTSLAEYLEKFTLPISIMQTEEELRLAALGLAKNAVADGVKYIEVRFAPQFHTNEGLKYEQIIDAVRKGLAEAKQTLGLESGIIVCAMRGLDEETNLKMLRASREFLGDGVVACDLAGNEAAYPPMMYESIFAEAKRLNMPYTIHAGECKSAANIADSIALGATRIGHGIAAIKMDSVMDLVLSKHVGLEMCPTSNLQTKAVESWDEYPLLQFMEKGILFNINTDNRTVSGTNLSAEYELLAREFKLTERDFKEIYNHAMEMRYDR